MWLKINLESYWNRDYGKVETCEANLLWALSIVYLFEILIIEYFRVLCQVRILSFWRLLICRLKISLINFWYFRCFRTLMFNLQFEQCPSLLTAIGIISWHSFKPIRHSTITPVESIIGFSESLAQPSYRPIVQP